MYLTRASTSIISLLSATMFFNSALAGLMDCTPTPGHHTIGYQSFRAGEDIIIDLFDPNCNSISHINVPHRANAASQPTGFTLEIHGVENKIDLAWEGWNYMHGPNVHFDGKIYQPGSCVTKGDDSACLTVF